MSSIIKKHIATGITWIAIEEADLYICCGCPADTVKHLKIAGVLNSILAEGQVCEEGPNAILLSDMFIQNGQIANLSEFPILQMLYMQGINLPDHPNYRKSKPILIGHESQIKAQLDYVALGNHGLSSIDEIMDAGISSENAKKIYTTKLYYSGGKIMEMQDTIDSCILEEDKVEIKNHVFIQRTGSNIFNISYNDEEVSVDLNLHPDEHYSAPYKLPFREVIPEVFSITHTGEGNGWDKDRPCMASVIHHQDKIYLIDAGPNILSNLSFIGIGLSEISGIFLSHIHDDHFAGITELLNVERKLNLYTTKLVRKTAEIKLKALTNSELDLINVAFNCIELEFNEWNEVNGMEIQPVYSPHTVETSIFKFRVFDGKEYKIYSHLSDTINFDAYNTIVENSPEIFSKEDLSYVRKNYLAKANLKKIDVGGGLIHGHLSDYDSDESDLLVMAHTSSPLKSDRENLINVNFGDTHSLIRKEDFDLHKIKTNKFVKQYFNTLDDEQLEILTNQKIKRFVPGERILSENDTSKKLLLILSGLVNYEDDSGIHHKIDAGNFIGYSRRYFRYYLPKEYTAWSYVHCQEFDEQFITKFIHKFSLIDELVTRFAFINILRESWLIHDSISNAVYNRISKYSEKIEIEKQGISENKLQDNIFIIIKGIVRIEFLNGRYLMINEHEHFGGSRLMREYRRKHKYFFDEKVTVLSIPVDRIEKVPKVLWMLIELEEKRYQNCIFKT